MELKTTIQDGKPLQIFKVAGIIATALASEYGDQEMPIKIQTVLSWIFIIFIGMVHAIFHWQGFRPMSEVLAVKSPKDITG